MPNETYIVEGSNWKCKVTSETNTDNDTEYRLIEAATRCIEHLFSQNSRQDCVDIFELTDESGVNFFQEPDMDENDIPDPSFGLLTKIYKVKDIEKTDNHYVIRTRTLMENASVYAAIPLITELESDIEKKNPQLIRTIRTIMKDRQVFKVGDLDKVEGV